MSKKYVIEIKPEYEDKFKGVMILGAENGNLYVDSSSVEELEELNSDYINEHFGDLQDTAYQRGFEDGKAVNDKCCEGCKYQANGELTCPCSECANNFKNQWTAKDDKIEVGDEVQHGDSTGIVYVVGDLILSGLCTGDESFVPFQWYKEECKKTGRRFETNFRQINEEETL